MPDIVLIGPVDRPELHVMTFNIRRRIGHLRHTPDLWSRRRGAVRRMLNTERPSVLGLQEALPDQVEFVAATLGGGYRSIGYGRTAERSGEHCSIFYDASRLDLLEWSQQALSDTPDKPGSTTWGNWNPRVVVRASFRDKAGGLDFLVVNTHFDHFSRKARLRSAEVVGAIARSSTLPVVVLGDFNTGVGSKPHVALAAVLRDAWLVAAQRVTEEWGTFPHYHPPRRGRKRIDWILVSSSIEVRKAAINVNRYGGAWLSDHAPVQVVLALPSDRDSRLG
jgi:endonuclease/exonuclease/phosphatase family metal-dependent hydrolase